MQFGKLKLKHCGCGGMLFSGPYIGKCLDLYGQYSESEVSMMRGFEREGSTVIDVGANIGDSRCLWREPSGQRTGYMQSSLIPRPSTRFAQTGRERAANRQADKRVYRDQR